MIASQKMVSVGARLGWTDVEIRHVIDNIDNVYENEHIVPLLNGRSIHTPSFPQDCDYVRIVQEGYELAYWDSAEWGEDSRVVMGAIMGCARGNSK